MALIQINAELGRVAKALERIAEALERAYPAAEPRRVPPSTSQISRVDYAEAYRRIKADLERQGEVEYEEWPYRPRQ